MIRTHKINNKFFIKDELYTMVLARKCADPASDWCKERFGHSYWRRISADIEQPILWESSNKKYAIIFNRDGDPPLFIFSNESDYVEFCLLWG